MLKKQICDFEILENKKLNHDTFLLLLKYPGDLPTVLPGQFAEVLVENAPHTFLRRPLSIHDVDYIKNTITLFIKIAGKGTEKLSHIKKGTLLNIIFPLGNTFTLLNKKKVLLAGGGCGVAPLFYLARKLYEKKCTIDIVLGAKSSSDILRSSAYKKFGDVHITTDDGSSGIKGFIIRHPLIKNELHNYDIIYTCGPERMMQSVASLAKKAGVRCEVSLENMMACGIGACLCCVTDTQNGHKCVCTDGPVFNINDLKWQI